MEVGSIHEGRGTALYRGLIPGIRQQKVSSIGKVAEQKVVLSDHIPITFDVSIESQNAGDGAWAEQHRFSVMSMNMLAYDYMSHSFWNSEPQDDWKEVWTLASRMRGALDRKTKWLPRQYSAIARTSVTDDTLSTMGSTVMTRWEQLNRSFWKWVSALQKDAFKEQVKNNVFAPDEVRLGILAQLLMARPEHDRPDLIFLQEVGLAELAANDFIDAEDVHSFPSLAFSEKFASAYPALQPMLQSYQVINASPKLNIRRGRTPMLTDTGIILAKKAMMQVYQFKPITHMVQEHNSQLTRLYIANAGKPIVGVQMLDQDGQPIADLFGAHFEKGRTTQNVRRLFKRARSGCSVPAMVTGDFNGVLRSNLLARS